MFKRPRIYKLIPVVQGTERVYYVDIFREFSRSCTRKYRAYQRWSSRELCSTLSKIIRLNASVEHWLGEPILDPDKEHGEVFRYMHAIREYCL